MYEEELKFLNDNIDLVETNQFDKLWQANYDIYGFWRWDKPWNNILAILYDKDVNINPLATLTSIPARFHEECTACPDHILLNPNTTDIGANAFRSTDIIRISGPTHPVKLDMNTFAECSELETIDFPIANLPEKAFDRCKALKAINIADGPTYVGKSVFAGCSSLTSIVLPESVTDIWEYAFTGCYALKQITIPSGLKMVTENTFEDYCDGNIVYNYCGNQYSTVAELFEAFKQNDVQIL